MDVDSFARKVQSIIHHKRIESIQKAVLNALERNQRILTFVVPKEMCYKEYARVLACAVPAASIMLVWEDNFSLSWNVVHNTHSPQDIPLRHIEIDIEAIRPDIDDSL